MSAPRIIGLGQPHAGDDGVGAAVVEYLRGRSDLELYQACAATELIDLLGHDSPVVVVDALLGGEVGCVWELEIASIASAAFVSSHGVGLREAIELAHTLSPERFTPRLHVVGVNIRRPRRCERGLSAAVSAAVPRAAALAVALCDSGLGLSSG